MLWKSHNWREIQAMKGALPVVVPLGSIEQHGHHLPLGTDTYQVEAIAQRVEKMLHDSIVMLPALWLGSSHHHLDFPGTLSLRPSLYARVIQDLVTGVLRAGFSRIFILNGHGGNEAPITQALSELSALEPLADRAVLASASWWQVGRIDPAKHDMVTPGISHACEYETSFMLHLHPGLVKQNLADERPESLMNRWIEHQRVAEFRRYSAITPAGSTGRPGAASAGKGTSMFDAVTADIVDFLRDFSSWPLPRHLGPRPGGHEC